MRATETAGPVGKWVLLHLLLLLLAAGRANGEVRVTAPGLSPPPCPHCAQPPFLHTCRAGLQSAQLLGRLGAGQHQQRAGAAEEGATHHLQRQAAAEGAHCRSTGEPSSKGVGAQKTGKYPTHDCCTSWPRAVQQARPGQQQLRAQKAQCSAAAAHLDLHQAQGAGGEPELQPLLAAFLLGGGLGGHHLHQRVATCRTAGGRQG